MERRAQLAAADVTLVGRISRGDLSAFETLYDRYAREVFVVAAHALGPTDAEEVVQDVFLKLWQRAGQFDPTRGSFAAWFMTIARHRVFDELKRRRSSTVVAEAVGDVLEAAPDPGSTSTSAPGTPSAAGSCSRPSRTCRKSSAECSSSRTSEA